MWSESPIDAPNLEHVEKVLLPDEMDKLKKNYETKIKRGIITQLDPPSLGEEQKDDQSKLVDKLRQDVKNVKTVNDLRDILDQVLTKLE